MRFSDRLRITSPKTALQIDSIDPDLRNGLWEACVEYYLNNFEGLPNGPVAWTQSLFLRDLYVNFLKSTSDNIDDVFPRELVKLKNQFFNAEWYDAYNWVEFFDGCASRNFKKGEHTNIPDPRKYDAAFRNRVNWFLEREKSAYRFVGGVLSPISSKIEVDAIEEAMSLGDRFSGARSHIQSAVALFSHKPEPDYRNAIKEAISAVESAVRIVTGDNKATLGDALRKFDRTKPLHPAFKQAMDKLYGYTSDEAGVRHSLIDLTRVDEADAKFMIVTCSAFVNFCVQRS